MKRNKLAAGALALALGLGAIAPSYAADAQATAVKENYSGAQLFLEKYEKELARVNDLRIKAMAAQEKIDAADLRLKNAKARLEKARAAYEALFGVAVMDANGKPITVEKLARLEAEQAAQALNAVATQPVGLNGDLDNIKNGMDQDDLLAAVKNYVGAPKSTEENPITQDQYDLLINRYVNAVWDLYAKTLKGSDALLAYQEFVAAQLERDAAQTNADQVHADNDDIVEDYNTALMALKATAEGYNLTVQVGNNGIKVVGKDDDKVEVPEKELTAAQIKELRKAVADAKTTLRAVELLRELAPQKIADVKVELDALVKAQEARIARAEAILAKYDMSASLFSVAYASEDKKVDEATSDEVDNLINDINDSTDKINELIKDKEEKPEEEKPEEKPEEDKKDDSKKDDSKKDEKPAEKPAAPKKEAGKNAKTGIAGVAGVAGVLAAATAAYAASKRK